MADPAGGHASAARPNVVVITSDDQGPWALGCAGNPEIETPHLDRLANRGIRFDNFFTTSPICSPARASLLTGMLPSQHGVHDWIRDGNLSPRAISYLEGFTSITGLLADAGYRCGLSGKWHLGDSATPQSGFDQWYALEGGFSRYIDPPMIRDGVLREDSGYITDLITDDALDFIDSAAAGDQPFWLSVNYTAPHHPWVDQHPQHYLDLYADCRFDSCPQEPTHPWLPSSLGIALRTAIQDPRPSLIGYFASITAMDSGIGRILDDLDRRGLTESTIVLFCSDNGFSCGQHGFWGKGNGTFPNNMYDTVVKVPAIISQPHTFRSGQVSHALVSIYDIVPTLLELTGATHPAADGLPGQSFAGLLAGTGSTDREHVVVYEEYGPVRMIRTQEWKYVHRYPFGPNETYDLVDDPDERINLVDDAKTRAIVDELRFELAGWFSRYAVEPYDGSQLPVTGVGQRDRIRGPGDGWRAFYPPRSDDFPVADLRRPPQSS